MDNMNTDLKRVSGTKEMDELKEKMKTRSTKLQEKFIRINEKLGKTGGAGINEKTVKSATPTTHGYPQQRRRTFSQTSTGSNDNNCEGTFSNDVNSITDYRSKNSDNTKDLRAKISRVRCKLSSSEKLSHLNDCLTRSRSNSERSLIRNNSIGGSKNYGRSISLTISETESHHVQNHKDIGSSKKLRRRRGQRANNSIKPQMNNDHVPIYARETENLCINAETLLILDLLLLPVKDHTDFLIKIAKTRKILVQSPDENDYQLNPQILRLRPLLMLGEQCREFNDSQRMRIETLAKTCVGQRSDRIRLSSESRRFNDERRSKIFEDYVNALIYEELPEDRKEEFLFPALTKRQRTKNYFCRPEFEENLEIFAQKCVAANLGRIVESDIRINAKNNDQAFIKNGDNERDAFLCSQLARKYALHGDIVRVFVRSNSDCKNSELTTTVPTRETNTTMGSASEELNLLNTDIENFGPVEDEEGCPISGKNERAFVIKIIKQVHNRKCVGNFLSYRKDSDFITFVPRDMKMPNIRIFKKDWPEAFQRGELENVSDILYVAVIIEWKNDICIGKILHPVGKCGELESENKAILLQHDLHMDPYDEKINEMCKGAFVIDKNKFKDREDLRSECVFTIDPLTARDLDDAMSCKELPDGNLEIGVHISDVAYFLEEESELDQIVKMRTTSVYMVNEVFHMLPKPLCYKCSLLPGEDKLSFSVFWVISKNGDILKTRFSRTIINSCTQFAYEHAQKIIDYPDHKYTEQDFPQIHNGFAVSDIVKRVNYLHSIAEKFRTKRFQNGALKINKPKLYFDLHPDIGEPLSYHAYILQPANFLIEEFMLLANQSVADFIWRKFPNISILRNHQPPLKNVIQKVKEKLDKFGMHLDISSSKGIYESFNKLLNASDNPEALEACLSQIVSKPMARARYLCSDGETDESNFWHFALSIPIYTHFTSPIRRYPDVMVHRVLSAALGYTPPPQRLPHELNSIIAICNEKKYTAKLAGEDSTNLYFLHYVKSQKSIIMRGAIAELCSGSMEVVLIDSGHTMRIQYPKGGDKVDVKIVLSDKETPRTALLSYTSQPNLPPTELKTFSEIQIEIYVDKLKLKGRIPSQPKHNSQKNEKIYLKEINDKTDESSSSKEHCVVSFIHDLALDDKADTELYRTPYLLVNNGADSITISSDSTDEFISK